MLLMDLNHLRKWVELWDSLTEGENHYHNNLKGKPSLYIYSQSKFSDNVSEGNYPNDQKKKLDKYKTSK